MIISIDDVATGLLVNAITAAGRWLETAAGAPRSGRGRAGEYLAIARWFETYKLTERVPDLPGLSGAGAARLAELLGRDDAQAAVQALLAVRLTDGPNEDAARAREAFTVTLAAANDPEVAACGEPLAAAFDAEICELVARLGDTPMLAQIRSEALSARMIAVLHAIERHTAALSARPALRTEADFLTRYRAHVVDQHGKLEPPDFERRQRVPIDDIYVSVRIFEEDDSERVRLTPGSEPPSITVRQLADRLDRTVLLGDPGGGKTTASTVLAHHFASDAGRRVPFLVTLRNFAADDPPARSVADYIEHELETFYQCPAPPGMVDLLLLTGRAVVIFDGLDELLDTARRADVSARVERFCMEYPLAPVLVTSRIVGYDQARLDDSQFSGYRLGGFRDDDVAEYARKWFALDASAQPGDADAFLTESDAIPDLRANPLLLSLLCILYRGEGSLPRNRAEVYEQCASLLFRRWDGRRHIHQELRAGHLLEPALRHLAWWLFTRADTQTAVTEHELIGATTEFLQGRGFEPPDDARAAAREFVEFSRGRLWVFSDAGTTSAGMRLYAFTHRTFMEYFAAAQLAYDCDTPEKLARTLAPRIAHGEWEVVGELSVQIKDSTSREGARRIYETLLDERRRRSAKGRSNVLAFLATTLRSVHPPPQIITRLTREVFQFLFSGDPGTAVQTRPLSCLLANCNQCLTIVDDEVAAAIAAKAASPDLEVRAWALLLAISLNLASFPRRSRRVRGPVNLLEKHWDDRVRDNWRDYTAAIIATSQQDWDIRYVALAFGVITVEQAIAMPGGLQSLFKGQRKLPFGVEWLGHLYFIFDRLVRAEEPEISDVLNDFAVIGHQLTRAGRPPWIAGPVDIRPAPDPAQWLDSGANTLSLDSMAFLGGAVVVLAWAEASEAWRASVLRSPASALGPLKSLHSYIKRRDQGKAGRTRLPELPVPEDFKQAFQHWAERKVDIIGPADRS